MSLSQALRHDRSKGTSPNKQGAAWQTLDQTLVTKDMNRSWKEKSNLGNTDFDNDDGDDDVDGDDVNDIDDDVDDDVDDGKKQVG